MVAPGTPGTDAWTRSSSHVPAPSIAEGPLVLELGFGEVSKVVGWQQRRRVSCRDWGEGACPFSGQLNEHIHSLSQETRSDPLLLSLWDPALHLQEIQKQGRISNTWDSFLLACTLVLHLNKRVSCLVENQWSYKEFCLWIRLSVSPEL